MDKAKRNGVLFVFLMSLVFPALVAGQIVPRGSAFTIKTEYPVFQQADSIYIFCSDENVNKGQLTANTTLSGEKTFKWEKYNNISGTFDFFRTETSSNPSSSVSQLADGCYRVTITKNDTTQIYRAWVMNEWFKVDASVTESNCEYFKLSGNFTSARLVYYDLTSKVEIELNKDIRVEWQKGSTVIARVNNAQIVDPPTEDTQYKYVVFDRFGCTASTNVTYLSIVTSASFTIDGKFDSGDQQGEAPLEVTFTNTSKNGTSGKYEWFFFRDIGQIKIESAAGVAVVDSFLFKALDDNLKYAYENTGSYMVKLVSKKLSKEHIPNPTGGLMTCTDTFYLKKYIVADSSSFDVPNFFTPNADGANDFFVVKFWSMQDAKITVANRWGRTVHFWEKKNIRGFEGTWTESVWDGKINGRYASPGVYYYVAEGTGRDGLKRWAHGFFHLLRGKE
jgi:gliding motility-associated-like protein